MDMVFSTNTFCILLVCTINTLIIYILHFLTNCIIVWILNIPKNINFPPGNKPKPPLRRDSYMHKSVL